MDDGRDCMEISLQNIMKAYGGKPVLRNISLSIRDHSLTTLLGPSGCGKTTLLRILAGLETPDAGDIYLGNRCVCSCSKKLWVPPEKRGIGFVFQNFALWPHMTVFENVAFGLRAKNRTENLKQEVERALSLVQLKNWRTGTLRSCPGVSSSGWPLPGPSSCGRTASCSTSLYRPWMRCCGCRCVRNCGGW